MTNINQKIYYNLYEIVFAENKYKKIILKKLLELNLPIDYNECLKLQKLFKNTTNDQIIEYFDNIKEFERRKYKNYEIIDYFFLKDISNNMKDEINKLKKILKNFEKFCQKIEDKNYKLISIAENFYLKENNPDLILEGGLGIINKIILREHKDIDFIDISDKAKNIIQYNVKLNTTTNITLEIFSKNFPLYKYVEIEEKNIYQSKKFNLKLFNNEHYKNKLQNTITLKRNVFLDLYEINKLYLYKFIKKINLRIRENPLYTFNKNFYPYDPQTIKHTQYFLKDNININQIQIINQNLSKNNLFIDIYLLIYFIINKTFLSLEIYDIVINKILTKENRSKHNIQDLYIALLFFLNIYKDLFKYEKYNLEERLELFFNLEILLRKTMNEYNFNNILLRNKFNQKYIY